MKSSKGMEEGLKEVKTLAKQVWNFNQTLKPPQDEEEEDNFHQKNFSRFLRRFST